MKNFGRALRLALKNRWTFAATVGCALAVAVLWGGNIGALFPFIEVVFQGKSLPDWVDASTEKAEKKSGELEGELLERQQQLDALTPAEHDSDEHIKIHGDLARITSRLEAERKALARFKSAQPYIHRYMPEGPFQTMVLVVFVLLAGTVIKDVFLVWSTILVERLSQRTTFNLRKQFFRRTLRMETASFNEQGTSALTSRFTNDMEQLAGGLQTLFGRAIREPLKMIACLIGASLICWRLLLLSLVLAPLAAFLIRRLTKLLKKANRRALAGMTDLYAVLEETISGIKVVKAFTMEPHERSRFHQTSKRYYQQAMKIARYNALVRPVNELLGITTICFAILAGAHLVLNDATHLFNIKMSDRPLDVTSLILFFGLLAGVSDPARKMSDVFSRLQRAAAAADRIYEMLDREPTIRDPQQPVPLPRHHRELVFENIHFGYRPDEPVLRGIDVRIAFGETLAIVGPNGSGKTTLANLVLRLFDPQSGRVMIDGVDIRHVRLRHLRSQIGMVSQETLLFDDTVYNNIRYGSPSASTEQIVEAAQAAHAHRFIENDLGEGYETSVGPRGNRLSGGQRQRIALARAILRDPAIMILDEATSQIDLESEQLIHRALEKFTAGRTTLIITHRLSTLDLADRILVLDEGQVVDLGTHDELYGRCTLYRRLHEIQYRESA